MTAMTNAQKKEMARLLFVNERLTQKEVAERVGISVQTMSKWVKEGEWEALKVSIMISKEEQIKAIYRQLKALNEDIDASEQRYPTVAQSDTIVKLSAAIDKLESESGLSDVINVFKEFFAWLRTFNVEEAQRIMPFFDDFVKSKL